MGNWLLNLPVAWMAAVVFAATYLFTGGIYWVVTGLAVNELARAFKAVSPGMLPPLGILFALLVSFIAVEVWGNFDKPNRGRDRGQRPACCGSARRSFSRGKKYAHLSSDQPSHR
jgi:hypothetical protein